MKALSALKGLVKLQAVIRGELVRRKVLLKMKFKPILFAKAEPQMCRIRLPVIEKDLTKDEWRLKLSAENLMESEEVRLIGNQNMRWDFSLSSKEDMEAMWFRKQEAIIKRERMKKYSYSHRERRNDQTLEEWMVKESGRKSCQISRWKQVENLERIEKERSKSSAIHPNEFAGETDKIRQLKLISNTSKQDLTEALNSPSLMPKRSSCHAKQNSNVECEVSEKREKERSKSVLGSSAFAVDAEKTMRQLKLISHAYKQDSKESLNSPFSFSRRSSLDPKQKFISEDFSQPNSPSFPTYMTATESAKAKIRSISTPKQRLLLSESFSGHHSPHSIRISPRNSSDGEGSNSSRKIGISQPLHCSSKGSYWD
ncbi:OLC1v1036678C1 [Oldenlandia corymbosa var. corymbosa]|nr:OLC1v1036678C1 [Oldenlandia corymbosa var. corymbosa]